VKLLKYIGEIGGIVGALMVATNTDLSAYGYIFFTASSCAWTLAACQMREWSLMRMSLVFALINFFGLYQWFM
jgi:nicotinamide riboside transporter PnuC